MLYVAVPVFLTWSIGSYLATPVLTGFEGIFPPQPLWVHGLQAVFVALLAAWTVSFTVDIRPWLAASVRRAAGTVAAVVFGVTLLLNTPQGPTVVQQVVLPTVNALGTAIPTAVGLYLYRGRSSASKFGNSSEGDA